MCVYVCVCVFPSSPSTLEPQCHQSRFESIQTERHELLGGREGREVQVSPRVLGHGTGTDVFLKKRRSTHASQLMNQRTCLQSFPPSLPSISPSPSFVRSLPPSRLPSFLPFLPHHRPLLTCGRQLITGSYPPSWKLSLCPTVFKLFPNSLGQFTHVSQGLHSPQVVVQVVQQTAEVALVVAVL